MTALERLTDYLCSQPGNGNTDAQNAYMARQILDQHKRELGVGSSVRFGRTEGLEAVQLADMLREDATALAALGDQVAATDDPLTLIRCLHATVGALFEVAPAALTAARLNPEAAKGESESVAAIYGSVTQSLARAYNALRDATDCI